MSKPKILIVEDEPLIAEDIADLCSLNGYEVCGTAYTAGQALVMIDDCQPNLVLLDINLNDEIDGTEIAAYIKKNSNIAFIYITSYSDKATLEKVKLTMPLGYIVKPFNKEQIYSTIEIAWSQVKTNLSPELNLTKLNSKLQSQIKDREAEVLSCLFQGMDTKQISKALFISANTVKFHIKKLYEKFEVHNRVGLMYQIREMTEKD